MSEAALELFAREYAINRRSEGRGYDRDALLELPYLRSGPHARQWAVRARTFGAFLSRVLRPAARERGRSLEVLDLGAGNGWLSYRVALEGHAAIALDIRDDEVDGLGASEAFLERAPKMRRLVAPFECVPLACASVDIALFNASIHYATDLHSVLKEAQRVIRPGGQIAILDSPFYPSEADGLAMVAEKRRRFGGRADVLMALPFVEFLTRERLHAALPGLEWTRHRVRYSVSYELRPLRALVRRERRPSRFDLWVARIS